MKFVMVALLGGMVSVSMAATKEEKIAERIQPVAKVCVEGDTSCAGGAVSSSAGPRTGEQVFNAVCAGCHGTGAMGSPKAHDAGAWGPRMSKGFDKVLANAINGLNMMPPKGTCADCSKEELGNAIKFMSK
ncbi:MAG: cytochrome c5 family protein [Oceanospirillaceae bacterium]|nr:cytochrome c5 family protein [Oceanospirillaceae bacterium]MCP5335219.1 cytochrome c5 family protein [Oceanospirillaceae bacterium]